MPSEPLPPATRPPRDLLTWERLVAGVVGTTGTAVGGVGIFLSTNQAGTAVILLLGLIFLLMAVQGTAVRRITREGADLADRDIERATADKVQATMEDQGAAAAQAALEAATAARPELESSPAVRVLNAQLYEREAIGATREAWRNFIGRRVDNDAQLRHSYMNLEVDRGIDALFGIADEPDPKMALDVMYSRDATINPSRLADRILRLNQLGTPYLIVSASRVGPKAKIAWRTFPRSIPRQIVHWRSGDDTDIIEVAIEALVGQQEDKVPQDFDVE